MNSLIRQSLIVWILVALAVCFFGFRFACDSMDLLSIQQELPLDERLEQLRQATLRRFEARHKVVRDLVAHECSLEEALVRFQELDDEWPDYVRELSKTDERYCSDEERNHQYILRIVKALLEKRPEESRAVLQRLEEDYQQLRADRAMP